MRQSDTYFRAFRDPAAIELWRKHRGSFFLLYLIAYRARRTAGFNCHDLKPGQALLGDCHQCGMTEQEYRTAKRILESAGFATFQPTNKGTVATLLNTEIFDINVDEANDPANDRVTTSQRPGNDRVTTNKNEKNEKNEEDVGAFLPGVAAATPASKPLRDDAAWLQDLKADPAYAGIDVEQEFARMRRWCAEHFKQPTRRRFINWLNRCDRTITQKVTTTPQFNNSTREIDPRS